MNLSDLAEINGRLRHSGPVTVKRIDREDGRPIAVIESTSRPALDVADGIAFLNSAKPTAVNVVKYLSLGTRFCELAARHADSATARDLRTLATRLYDMADEGGIVFKDAP